MDLRWIVHSCFIYYVHIHAHGNLGKTTKSRYEVSYFISKNKFLLCGFYQFFSCENLQQKASNENNTQVLYIPKIFPVFDKS